MAASLSRIWPVSAAERRTPSSSAEARWYRVRSTPLVLGVERGFLLSLRRQSVCGAKS